jgi:hypothetical protein
MNTNLYALRPDLGGVSVLVAGDRIVLSAIGRDFELVFSHRRGMPCSTMFDMLADRDEEVACIYTSFIDGKEYVEWLLPKPLLPVLITDEGILMALNTLPPEEFPFDDPN